jgi:hypothetical protein
MKTGLIIQGPILSPGYTPYFFDKNGNYQKTWVDYDSAPNILNLVNQASTLFDYIVLVTWKTSDSSDFLKMLHSTTKIEIVEITENAFLIDERIKGRSKYHQIETMHAGAKKLRELGCDVLAKVRTTHGINIEILFNDVLSHTNRNKRSVGVSYMNLFESDRLVDYHFVGNTDVIESMCESYLLTPELFQGVHEDYYWKFAKFLSGNVKLNENYKLFVQIRNQIRIISDWTQVFYPLDRRLLKNFYWRGVKVNSNLNFWIFWSFLFHAKNSRGLRTKTFGNLVLVTLVQILIRPFMRLYSFFAYKFYRHISAR